VHPEAKGVQEKTAIDWRNAASAWEKHRDLIRDMFAPVTQALIEDALIQRGHTVLDIATGPGEPALTVAEFVGAEGKVFGIDPAPEMIAAARREAERLGLKNAQFETAGADHLPFPADTFDGLVSRFGVMFFPSPVDAVREMLRVLKPGRTLALAAWHFAEKNPFLNEVTRIVDLYAQQHLNTTPDAPDTFRFASPGKLKDVFVEAGVLNPSERLLQCTMHVPVSVEACLTLRCEMSEKLRDKMAVLSAEQLTEVKRQSLEALRPYANASGMSFPAEVLIVSGAKEFI
jgi:ubiquinone/menaquinone biosynthesis C-methylase UbiE